MNFAVANKDDPSSTTSFSLGNVFSVEPDYLLVSWYTPTASSSGVEGPYTDKKNCRGMVFSDMVPTDTPLYWPVPLTRSHRVSATTLKRMGKVPALPYVYVQ